MSTTNELQNSNPVEPSSVILKKKRSPIGTELKDLFEALDSYSPTLPDAVSKYYLQRGGMMVKDERIPRFVSLVVDKYMTEVIYEAKQISQLRQNNLNNKSSKRKLEMSETLEMEDLERSLAQVKVLLHRKIYKAEDEKSTSNT